MALAVKADVEARLRRSLTSAELLSIEADLDDASAEVIGYCRQDFSGIVPSAVAGVVAKMVARSYARSASSAGSFAEQQNAGPFGVRYSADTSVGDVWMTRGDRLALRPYRVGGGMSSVALVGDRYEITDDES